MIEYTNSLEESLTEAKEYTASLSDSNAKLLQRIDEQQKMMLEQQEKFMKMILDNQGGSATGGTPISATKATAGTRIGPRTCGICKLDGQHHLDKDCFELPSNKDKRPAWYLKKKNKE